MKNFKEYNLEGVFSFESQIFKDDRGYFFEAFNQKKVAEMAGKEIKFVQDNISESTAGVIRGLHFQKPPHAQGKLVRVLKGEVIDIIVDIRKDSKTYGESLKFRLSEENALNVYVPRGFAHGFATLKPGTLFSYKCDNPYNKESEGAIQWNDPTLNLDWELRNPIISAKDNEAQAFKNFDSPFTN